MATLLPIAICMLVCPVVMFILMKGMGSKVNAGKAKPDRTPKPARATLTREEQLVKLKTRLASSQAERETLTRELDQVERDAPPVARGAQASAKAITEARGRRHKGGA